MKNSNEIQTGPKKNLWFFGLATLAFLASLFFAHFNPVNTSFGPFFWVADETEIQLADGSWVAMDFLEVGAQPEILDLRFHIEIDENEKWRAPTGLRLSGPFSADIFWDGKRVGRKGVIGNTKSEENPGKIDSLTFLSPDLLNPGLHQLDLRVSTLHLNYDADNIFHIVSLGPFRDDDRRSLRYYSTPLLIFSGLALLILQFMRMGIDAGNRLFIILSIFAGFVLLQLMAEVSRAVINYPYSWHYIRGAVMGYSGLAAGMSLLFLTFTLEKQKWARAVILVGVLTFLFSFFFYIGGDRQIARNFLIITAAPALIYLVKGLKKQINLMTLIPVFWVFCFISVQLSYGIFLDVFFFAGSLVLLTSIWFGGSFVASPNAVTAGQKPPENFLVKSKGREIPVSLKDILFIRAEGNFSELNKADGVRLLYQERLGQIMNNPPKGFKRIHKSYAVNLDFIKALRSAEGSKYWLEIKTGGEIPVSRYRVSEIREILKGK